MHRFRQDPEGIPSRADHRLFLLPLRRRPPEAEPPPAGQEVQIEEIADGLSRDEEDPVPRNNSGALRDGTSGHGIDPHSGPVLPVRARGAPGHISGTTLRHYGPVSRGLPSRERNRSRRPRYGASWHIAGGNS